MLPSKRILLVEDDPDYEKLVRTTLAASEEPFQVKSASSLTTALALIEHFSPDLILVDLNIGDSVGYKTFQIVREHASGIPIVVLTGQDDDTAAIRAVMDGAQDYIVKSTVKPKHIIRCIKMALSRHNRHTKHRTGLPYCGKVLSFIGAKGGIGTSTLAMNVASLMSQNALDPLLIEFQVGGPGTSSMYLETHPAHGLKSLLRKPPESITESDLRSCLIRSAFGLQMMCPGESPGISPRLSAAYAIAIIELARKAFPFVVLDLPSQLDEGVVEALKQSDSVTLVIDRESSSIHCGRMRLEEIREFTPAGRAIGMALVDRAGLPYPMPLTDIKVQIQMHPWVIIPSAASSIALSQAARTPLTLLYPNDHFSLAHAELVDRLIPPSDQTGTTPKGKSTELDPAIAWRAIPETTYS